MKSVLYLGCPAPERADAEKQLGAVNVSVVWGENAAFALSELRQRNMPVLLDLSNGASALQIAREIRSQRASTLMFAVVDSRRPDLTTEAVLAGMADVFARPIGGRRVANAIERERKYEAHDTTPAAPLENGDELYAHSLAMREAMALISRAAGMRAGVLVRGEEGSGRQLAARAIHALQRAGDGAFVAVDCGAFDGAELDAQLFGAPPRGHNGDGASGLERVSRQSRLHHARGGTIYLQNIAEAPTRVQARLARLLRDREAIVTETGGAIPFDVRPVAGVGPGFDMAVEDGRVREDLVAACPSSVSRCPRCETGARTFQRSPTAFFERSARRFECRPRHCRDPRCRCSRRSRGEATPKSSAGCSTRSSSACKAVAESRSTMSWRT
jgi:Response regulator containing CheY-like receiver, AAA-type ATPase, and DNA-binding domains